MSAATTRRPPSDLTGQQFGRLTVQDLAGIDDVGDRTWRCACSCGTVKVISGRNLRRTGRSGTRSCGCLRSEHAAGMAAKRMAKRRAA